MAIELNDQLMQNNQAVTWTSTDLELYQLFSEILASPQFGQSFPEMNTNTTEVRTSGRRQPPNDDLLRVGIINGFNSYANARRSAGMRNYWARRKNSDVCFSAGSVNTDVISSNRPYFVAARRPVR